MTPSSEFLRPQASLSGVHKTCKNSGLQLVIISTGQYQLLLVPEPDVMFSERFPFKLKTLSV